MRSTNRPCTTSVASSRLLRMRSALRTSAGPNARYASRGSLAGPTRDPYRDARRRLERAVLRTLEIALAGAAVAVADAERAGAAAARARAVVVAKADLAGGALAERRVALRRRCRPRAGRAVGTGERAVDLGAALAGAAAAGR